MTQCLLQLRHFWQLISTLLMLLTDATRFLQLCLRPPAALAAENLFLRKQLALYQERQVKPQRATNATRLTLTWLARWFDWRQTLAVVQPADLSPLASPGIPPVLALEIHLWTATAPCGITSAHSPMTRDNPTWGQERIANELLLKLGLRVSPRTVRKYMPQRGNHRQGKRASSTLADLSAQSCQGYRGL